MKIQNRNGVLGLETAKSVMIAFLVLAITGVAVILALTTLQTATTSIVDVSDVNLATTNESDNTGTVAWLNATPYQLKNTNTSTTSIGLVAIWSSNGTNYPYNLSVALGNATLNSSGYVVNATTTGAVYGSTNISYSYAYVYTYDNQRTDVIVGNVTSGVETFFGSTGTIFSILIVVVIILAISVIIWAVGRFGQQTETQDVNL